MLRGERRAPPPGSHHSPTSPKTAGGGWGGARIRRYEGFRAASDGGPLSRPLPRKLRGREVTRTEPSVRGDAKARIEDREPVEAGANSPLSVRNERGGAGGGAPRRAPARCNSPSPVPGSLRGPARANEFAATPTRRPPSRTGGRVAGASTCHVAGRCRQHCGLSEADRILPFSRAAGERRLLQAPARCSSPSPDPPASQPPPAVLGEVGE